MFEFLDLAQDQTVEALLRRVIREEIHEAVAPLRDPRSDIRLLTPADVARRLRCSTRTVNRLVTAGKLAYVSCGRSRLVHPDALDAYIRSSARIHR